MKVSQNWLSEFVSLPESTKKLTDQLTLAGLEVDSVESVAGEFTGIVVGEVIEKEKHPNADKLSCCKVNVGNEILDIVCGAPNVYKGMKAPVALIGAILPDGLKIKKGKLRGEVSNGMLCSEKELGLSDESNGLMELPIDAPVGDDIRSFLKLDDVSIEVDLTPNRADCLSVEGIAREIAALNQTSFKPLEFEKTKSLLNDQISIEIKDEKASPKYLGRIVKDVNTKAETPLWMKERLRRSGLRSISIVVDITNYVLLELGQPMHAFDLEKIDSGIIVRKAKQGESLVLLDESKITLNDDTLIIADHKKALAIAGIMGGFDSSVTDTTKDILLESAFFSPIEIAGKARNYGLHTDSSHRFERGVNPELAERALEYATTLLVEIAGGKASKIAHCVNAEFLPENKLITLTLTKIKRLLGIDVTNDQVELILKALQFELKLINDTSWQVKAPAWRFDISIEEDLIEEIARLYGYENIEEKLPQMPMATVSIKEKDIQLNEIRKILITRGFREAITYSFIDPKFDQFFASHKSLPLKNPIASDMALMRQSLIPGLLMALKNNVHRQQNRVRLFEMGNCFITTDDKGNFNQRQKIAGVICGSLNPLQWRAQTQADFYDLKNDVNALLSLKNETIKYQKVTNISYLHSGKSAAILDSNNKIIGLIGELHPSVQKLIGLKAKPPVVFELDFDLFNQKTLARFETWSKYPIISRDLAIVVDQTIEVDTIKQTIKNQVGELLSELNVFDLYQGENIKKNEKSIAFNLILQDSSKTLKDEDVNEVISQIVEKLKQQYQATLRE